MNMRIRLIAAGLVAIGVMTGPATLASEQDVTLRYRWTKGDNLRYRHTQQSTAAISGLPGMGDMTVDSTMAQVFKVAAEDVAPGLPFVDYQGPHGYMIVMPPRR